MQTIEPAAGSPAAGGAAAGSGPRQQESPPPPKDAPGNGPGMPEILQNTSINSAQGQLQFATVIQNIVGQRERSLRAKLSRRDFILYDLARIEAESLPIVYEDAAMEAMAAELIRRRLLVLVGEAGLGKRSLAIALARRVWQEEGLGSMLLLAHPPDREAQVNLRALLAELDAPDRFLILPDAFDGGNAELRRYFSNLTQNRVEEITDALRDRRAFLVLTASYDSLGEQIAHRVRELYLTQVVRSLPPAFLDLGLHKRVESKRAYFLDSQPDLAGRIDGILASAATCAEIVQTLGTMPKIAEFVDEWLLWVAREEITLHQALRRVATLESWLLFNAQRSLEEWSYTLALVLCHASRATAPCSWLQFDLVRRELTRFLRRELRPTAKPGERHDGPMVGDDEALCRAARAEVRQAELHGACTIQFREEGYAEEIWRILFGPGRRLLSLLHAFCERQVLEAQSQVAEMAARALGRIGEADPRSVVRWMSELLALADESERAPRLGALFKGILGSPSAAYRNECLWYLRRHLVNESALDAATAIRSLRWIGELDAEHGELALTCLQWAAGQKLTARLKDLNRVEAKLHGLESWLQSIRDYPDHHPRSAGEEGFNASLVLLFPDGLLAVLFAVEQTLIYLGLAHGPGWLLAALQKWMTSPEPLLRPLMTLLFLRSQGIADTLEAIKVPLSEEAEGRWLVSPDLSWLLEGICSPAGREDAEILAGFLEEVFATFPSSSIPSLIKPELRPRLRRILKSWAKQGLAQPESRDAILHFFKRLVGGGSKLAADLGAWIQGSTDLAKDVDLAQLRTLLPASV